MPIIPLSCPSCGANLKVDSDKDAAICEFCGKPYIVKDAIVNNYINMHINQATINADSVNIITQKDFEIKAGKLIKYTGENQEIIIPNNVTEIGDEAFARLNITNVIIPDSVTLIGVGAFRMCKSLKKIDIPDSVTDIGANAFQMSGLEEVKLPANLKTIRSGAFSSCISLKEVNIPNRVTTIENVAFYECLALKEVKIPNSVTTIANAAFYGCLALKEVTMPEKVLIGHRAFANTPLWKDKCQQCGGKLVEASLVDKMRGFKTSCTKCNLVYK